MEDKHTHGVSRRTALGAAAAAITGLGLAACGAQKSRSTPELGTAAGTEVASIARDAYLYGYPLVLLDVTRLTSSATNQLLRISTPANPHSRTIVAPQNDTLFSWAWLDLRTEPIVFEVPTVDSNRYWILQVLDAWMNTVHNPSSVRPQIVDGRGAPPFRYVLTGPGWSGSLPDGLTQLAMPTGTVFAVHRLQVDGGADVGHVRTLQAQVRLLPLSTWVSNPDAPTPTAQAPKPSVPPLQQVNAMDGRTFFSRMTALMAANPSPSADADALKRFASIGIAAGRPVDSIDDNMLDAAVRDGQQQISTYTNPQAKTENGWPFMFNIGTYGTDYSLRASTSRSIFGANLPEDCTYAIRDNIDAGTGSALISYRMRFAPDQLPPVDAFWSLTAYDVEHFLIPNPDNIYSVGHQLPLAPDVDGAYEIALQHTKPGPDIPTANWLPIPESGKFSLALRFYAPREAILQGRWQPPPLTQTH